MKSRKIRYISLDFDGCLFHSNYLNEKMQRVEPFQALTNTNQQIIKFINNDLKHHPADEVVCMIGSNRQSVEIDNLNGKQMRKLNDKKQSLPDSNFGSCYTHLPNIAAKWIKHKNCRHDGYILADSYGNVKPGTNFNNASSKKTQAFNSWFFDHTKISILYAQMHKAAVDHPDAEEIIFDFYDDRIDILKSLTIFFRLNPDLMPHNVKLRLFKYNGGLVSEFASVNGTGKADPHYGNSVVYMSELANIKQDDERGIGIALLQNPEMLRIFKSNIGKDILPGSIEHTLEELDTLMENLDENTESDKQDSTLTASLESASRAETRYESIETMRLVNRKLLAKIERSQSIHISCQNYINYFRAPGALSFTDRLYELKRHLFNLGNIEFNLPVVDEKIREFDNLFRSCYLAINIKPDNYHLILQMNTEAVELARAMLAITKIDDEKTQLYLQIAQAEMMNHHIHEAMKLMIGFSKNDKYKNQSLLSIFTDKIQDAFSIIARKLPDSTKEPLTAYARAVNWQRVDSELKPSNRNLEEFVSYFWNKGTRKDREFLSSHGYGNRLLTFFEWTASRVAKASTATMQAVTSGVSAVGHQAGNVASAAAKMVIAHEPSCPSLDSRPTSVSGCLEILSEIAPDYIDLLGESKDMLIIHGQNAKLLEDHVGYKFIGTQIKEELEAFKKKYPSVNVESLRNEAFMQEYCVFRTKDSHILPLVSDELETLKRGDTPKQFYQRVHPGNYEGLFSLLNAIKYFCQTSRNYAQSNKYYRFNNFMEHFELQIAQAESDVVNSILSRLKLVGHDDLVNIKPFVQKDDSELTSFYPRFMTTVECNIMKHGQSNQKMTAIASLSKLKLSGEIFSVQDIKQMNQYILRYGSDAQKAELYRLYEINNAATIPLPEPGRSHLVPDLSAPSDTFETIDETGKQYLAKYINKRLGIESITLLRQDLQPLYDSFIRRIDWNNPEIDTHEGIAFAAFDAAYIQAINQYAKDTANEVMPDNELYLQNFMLSVEESTQPVLPALEDIPSHIYSAYKKATKKEVKLILLVDADKIDEDDVQLADTLTSIIIESQQRPTNCYAIANAVNRYLGDFYDIIFSECMAHDKEFAAARSDQFYVEFNKQRDALFIEFIEAYNRNNDNVIEFKLTPNKKLPLNIMNWVSQQICGDYKVRFEILQQDLHTSIHGYIKSASRFPQELKHRLIQAMPRVIANYDSESPATRINQTLTLLAKTAELEAILLRMEYACNNNDYRDQFARACMSEWRHSGLMYQKEVLKLLLDDFIMIRLTAFKDMKDTCAQFIKILDQRGTKKGDTSQKKSFISSFRKNILKCESKAELADYCRAVISDKIIPVNLKAAINSMLSAYDWEEKLKLASINTLTKYLQVTYPDADHNKSIQIFLDRCKSMCLSVFFSEITHLKEVHRGYNLHPLWQQLNLSAPDQNAGKLLEFIYSTLLSSISDIDLISKKSNLGIFDKTASRLAAAEKALIFDIASVKFGISAPKFSN